MSQLREQLQCAHGEYRHTRYPGDLAHDVLPARRAVSPLPMVLGGLGAALAAAAAVLLAVLVHPARQREHDPSRPPLPLVKDVPLKEPRFQWTIPTIPELPGLPQIPRGMRLLLPEAV
ncbi:MAG TPA: hypothetical protein VG269_20960 [Tepidisphaeraceae bacterium]|jgi:hypothetical protein|nr:hypothetical protein [Tepidisphaeraceae bacterium]